MSTVTTIVLLLAVAIFALVVVSIANHLHTRQQLFRQKCQQLRRRVTELEEIALTVEPLVESLAIPKLLNDENLALTHTALQLEPDSQSLQAHLQRAEALAEDFSNPDRPRTINRLLESDSAIARARYYVNEAIHILRRQHAKGALEVDELDMFISELAWAHLMVQVISMVGQGHKAMKRGNLLSAMAFYRKAQQSLMDTVHSDRRRHPMIRELGEILDGTRRTLSPELMPEVQYNNFTTAESPQPPPQSRTA